MGNQVKRILSTRFIPETMQILLLIAFGNLCCGIGCDNDPSSEEEFAEDWLLLHCFGWGVGDGLECPETRIYCVGCRAKIEPFQCKGCADSIMNYKRLNFYENTTDYDMDYNTEQSETAYLSAQGSEEGFDIIHFGKNCQQMDIIKVRFSEGYSVGYSIEKDRLDESESVDSSVYYIDWRGRKWRRSV